MFDILALHAEFFAVRRSEPVDLFTLCIVLIVGMPLPFLLATGLAGWLSENTRRYVQGALVSVLCTVIILPLLTTHTNLDGIAALFTALGIGVILALSYLRQAWIRQILSFASIAVLMFPALFLLDPAIRKLIIPADTLTYTAHEIISDTPVVLFVFDAFPTSSLLNAHQEIDAEIFPNFAILAEESTWYRNVTTVSESTIVAVPAILTGRYPRHGLQPTLQDHPRNLFTLLQDVYQIHARKRVTNLNPETQAPSSSFTARMQLLLNDLKVVFLHILLPENWRSHLPPISQSWESFGASNGKPTKRTGFTRPIEKPSEFLDTVAQIDSSIPRSLWVMHFVLPHGPANLYPSGRFYSQSTRQPSGQGNQWGAWLDDELVAVHGYQRHLLQVQLVDHLMGRLISRLRETGLWDSAVIIITADHGESFRKGDDRRDLTHTNFADILSVPLFIRAPGLEQGRINDTNVQNLDILPSIMDLLGIQTSWEMDGISVLDPRQRPPRRVISALGEEFPTIPPGIIEARRESANRKLALFGTSGSDRPYRLGPDANLPGRHIDSFPPAISNPQFVAGLRHPRLYKGVSLDKGFVPGEIVGMVERQPPESAPPWIVVAVNDVIRAVTRPYEGDNSSELAIWSALIPEGSFRNGDNDIKLFTLEIDPSQEIQLRKVAELNP